MDQPNQFNQRNSISRSAPHVSDRALLRAYRRGVNAGRRFRWRRVYDRKPQILQRAFHRGFEDGRAED